MRTAANVIAGKKKAFLWRVASAMACIIVPVAGYSRQDSSSDMAVAKAKAAAKAQSDELGFRPSFQTCLDKSEGAMPAMHDCSVDEYNYQDKRLNKAYKALMAVLSKDKQAKLQAEEKIWIAYRDSHCQEDPDIGQSGRLIYDSCMVTETARQAGALEYRKYLQSDWH